MSKSLIFIVALFALIFIQSSNAGFEPCLDKPGYDEILVQCRVLEDGASGSKSLFEVTHAEFCIRKREVSFHEVGPAVSYYVEGQLDGSYLGTKPSKDGIFPGERNDSGYLPKDDIRDDDRQLSVSGYTLPNGEKMSWHGMEAEISGNKLTITNEALDGIDRYYQHYRSRAKFDFGTRILEVSYERDFSALPIIRSWKTLLNTRLRCE